MHLALPAPAPEAASCTPIEPACPVPPATLLRFLLQERRPIIEFAIENAKILKAREAKLARAKQSQQQQQQGGGEEPPAKRIKGRQQGNAQQQQQKEGEEAEGLGGVDQLPVRLSSQGSRQAEGGEVQQQQSKRQRRREIKQKLRAVRQQKAQEAAAAAAVAAQQKKKRGAKDGVEGPDGGEVGKAPENIRQNKAKKRRELRKAKKQGGVTGVGVQAASAALLPISAAEKPPSQQVLQGGVRQAGKQHVQGKGQAKTHLLQRPQKKLAGQQGQGQQQKGPNTKSAKAAQQAQHEQQAKQRKRSADDELDSMVAGMTGGFGGCIRCYSCWTSKKIPRMAGDHAQQGWHVCLSYYVIALRADMMGGCKILHQLLIGHFP